MNQFREYWYIGSKELRSEIVKKRMLPCLATWKPSVLFKCISRSLAALLKIQTLPDDSRSGLRRSRVPWEWPPPVPLWFLPTKLCSTTGCRWLSRLRGCSPVRQCEIQFFEEAQSVSEFRNSKFSFFHSPIKLESNVRKILLMNYNSNAVIKSICDQEMHSSSHFFKI